MMHNIIGYSDMAQHFLLSAAARTLSLKAIFRMSDDEAHGMFQAIRFAWNMGRLNPERVVLPVVPRTTSGGAAVLDVGDGGEGVLAQFR